MQLWGLRTLPMVVFACRNPLTGLNPLQLNLFRVLQDRERLSQSPYGAQSLATSGWKR